MSDLKRKIKRAFGFWARLLAGTAVVLFLALSVVAVPKWQVQKDLRADRISWSDVPQQENEYRKTLIQIAGGVVVAFGLYLTWRRINATEETQVTDRFSEAVEQLGDPSLEVRLGGIYALERIAEDSPRDHWAVMEILSAFVRENASSSVAADSEGTEDEEEESLTPAPNVSPDTDVQAACTVIGRRKDDQDPEKAIDLSGASLSRVELRLASLSGANLHKTDLSWAFLFEADLAGAYLREADLPEAYLRRADLSGVELARTDLSGANLVQANLSGANLARANLSEAHLSKADLSGANLSGADLSGASLRDADLSEAYFYRADLTGADVETSALVEAETLCDSQLNPTVESAVRDECPELLEKM